MNKTKISMITITFNSEKTLKRTIDSVISQNYENLEYIIIDGGSTDSTLDIVKSYGDKISKYISESDDGISDAFNKGIHLATGDVIGIINSDDGLLPGALEAVSNAYSESVDIYRGKVLLWNEDTDTKIVESPCMKFDYGFSKVCHQGTFVTAAAYHRFGYYDVQCRYMMDYDLLLRYYRAGATFKEIEETLAFYTLGGLTTTKYTKKRQKELEYVLAKNGASKLQIMKCSFVRGLKRWVKKIIGTDSAIKLRNTFLKKMR